MNFYFRAIIFLFIFPFFINLTAQNFLYSIQEINVENGLPDREVYAIVQDKQGFIWLSTEGAISRYDGKRFKNYYAKGLGIAENAWCRLAVDNLNNIWFHLPSEQPEFRRCGIIETAADSIISVENYTEGFLKSEDILDITSVNNYEKNWFISTKQGIIYQFENSLKEVYRHANQEFDSFIKLETDPFGNFWILNGTEIISKKTNGEKKIYNLPEHNFAVQIIQFSPFILIKSFGTLHGTNYWKLEEGDFKPHLKKEDFGAITGITKLNEHHHLHIKYSTLFIENDSAETVFEYQRTDPNLHDRKIRALAEFRDKQGIVWIGLINGLLKVTQREKLFKTHFEGHSVRGIYAEENSLWLGTYHGNLQIIDGDFSRPFRFTKPYESQYGFVPPTSFIRDYKNRLWAGSTEMSILKFEEDNPFPTLHPLQPRRYYTLFNNSEINKIWVGSNEGLFYLDESKMEAVKIKLPIPDHDLTIRHFYKNEKGIWVVTNKGILLMDAKSERVKEYFSAQNGFPADNFNHLHEDKNGIFWLATAGNGLIKWNLEQHQFQSFTKADGLSNNVLYAVYEDEFENLWLPSNYGLMCFDKKSLETQLYLQEDGIAHEEFNTYAHFQAYDGTLYFGGLNGLTSFHPKDIQEKRTLQTPLIVTGVHVFGSNKETFKNITPEFLKEQKINLKFSDQILSLDLALLDFESNEHQQFAYQIEGYREAWIYTTDNKISLFNLPSGKFILNLKARGARGANYSDILQIPIEVYPPFYRRWWFILLIISLLASLVRWRFWQIEKDRQRLEEEVKKRTLEIEKDKKVISKQAEELRILDKVKSRFFSNITHEFRTPLTLIIGPLKQIISDRATPSALYHRLTGILNNSQHLLRLINQLLDFAKIESNELKVEWSKGDIIFYTQKLVKQIEPLAIKKNQTLNFQTNLEKWETHFDKNSWDKIIYNLLSNAIKFTPVGGSIQVDLQKKEQENAKIIQLKVQDNGIGIGENNLEKVFNRFYQIDSSATRLHGGTGIGLALVKELVELQNGEIKVKSKIGEGTLFELKIPVPKTEVLSKISNLLETQIQEETTFILPNPNLESSPTKKSAAAQQNEKLELLIIEDNAAMRDYIRQCLDESKYHILEAEDGVAGIEIAKKIIPDLIISDVMMPKKDGFEVVKSIRENISTSHIPLILLTAKTSLDSRLKGLARGADAYLTKPFNEKELALRIEKLIELRQFLQKRYSQNLDNAPKITQKEIFQKEDKFITDLKTFIRANIDNPKLNVEFIASHFLMNRMQLHRKLKALTNQTAGDFIRIARMDLAVELLNKGDLNISEIAYQTGFSYPSHFTNTFKKHFGKPPSEMLENG